MRRYLGTEDIPAVKQGHGKTPIAFDKDADNCSNSAGYRIGIEQLNDGKAVLFMKAIMKKRILPVVLLLAMLAGLSLPCVATGGSETVPVVSYGLSVLAARTDVALSAMVGNDIVFSADAFARGMNLSSVRYITVQSVPPVTDGELLLGSSKIVAGQTVSAEQLPNMVYHPETEEESRSSFTFTVNGGATPMVCSLYMMEEKNYTPTVSLASGLSLHVNTYRGMSAHGTLSAYDPDGDELIFEIVSYPKNGYVRLTDANLGSYVYSPNENYVGTDAFTYVARDRYGNYSAAATVSLRIDISGTSVTYVDMANSPAYNAALKVTEGGIMSGTQVGSQYYFYPEQSVSRVEFLVMAMNAAGMREVPDCKATSFADDDDIPATMKGYVAVAYSLGYISGSQVEGELCFLPNEEITRAEAAVMLEKLLGLEDAAVIPTFADHSEIPVWAADAIYSLNAAGILVPTDGYISAGSTVTREHTAQILAAVMEYEK